MQEVNYKNIRNATSHISWYERTLSEHLCMSLSPFVSILFIKKKVTPNTVTLLMIISGIIAPLLFMANNIFVQCVAAFLFILWFILDCSDGEVARFTSTFSNRGRDLDYLSHVSCHSLFVIAMWKLYAYQSEYLLALSFLFFALLSCELFYRMTVLYSVYIEKSEASVNSSHKLRTCVLMNLTYFPNYVVFFPALYCISYFIGINMLLFFVAIFSIYILVKLKAYVLMVWRFYKA